MTQKGIRSQRIRLAERINKVGDKLIELEERLEALQMSCSHPRYRTSRANRGLSTCLDCYVFFKNDKRK
jgi:hypothetical protein